MVRKSSLLVTALAVLAAGFFSQAPASAVGGGADRTAVTHTVKAKAPSHINRTSMHTPAPAQATGPNQISEGGCGFLQRCIYLSRSEQLVILAGGSATVVVLLCSVTAIIGCALATGIVAAAFQWLSSRGGACPVTKPKLRVQYIPWPQVEGCVA